MSRFLEALGSGKVILMDGAMGTELMRIGAWYEPSRAVDNLTRPAVVRQIHQSYCDAGAACLLTNTFQAHVPPVRRWAIDEEAWRKLDWPMINRSGVSLARAVAQGDQFVVGDIGPPADLWEAETAPENFLREGAINCLQQQECLVGCDAILFETQPSMEVVGAIVELARAFAMQAPWIASFAFRNDEGEPLCDHQPPEVIADFVADHRDRFIALGVNCGRDIAMDQIVDIVRRYRRVTDLPILARPNAGTPKKVGEQWVYPETPARMATRLPELIEAGATLIGGCCGTTPEHIAAFREVIDRLGVGWKP
jgi:methionine synthase I (cobalamin-dependent)